MNKRINKLLAIKNIAIGRIELGSLLDIDTVTEIFVRINSEGVVLSQADFAMSKISVNKLLSGERIEMKNYDENVEKNLLDMVKQKEESDKRLLRMEILMGIVSILPLLISTVIVLIVPLEEWLGSVIVGTSVIPLLIATPFALKIEQTAGYYECGKCGNRYVPEYKSVFIAGHIGRTRYMKCPKCNKRSWQKKVISKR